MVFDKYLYHCTPNVHIYQICHCTSSPGKCLIVLDMGGILAGKRLFFVREDNTVLSLGFSHFVVYHFQKRKS